MPKRGDANKKLRRNNNVHSSSRCISLTKKISVVLVLVMIKLVADNGIQEIGTIPTGKEGGGNSVSTTTATTTTRLRTEPTTTRVEVTKEETTPKPIQVFHVETFQQQKQQATKELQALQEANALTTAFSQKETVIQQGFPRVWKPCAVSSRQQDQALTVTVLGGTTAAASTTCAWSKALQDKLLSKGNANSHVQFELENMAREDATSVQTALLMDTLVDPKRTDVILWEFLVNEGPEDVYQTRKLDFFLTRVRSLYAHVHKPPPPIVLVYLWGSNASTQIENGQSLDANPLQYTETMIDKYRDLGWNIAVMNVGKIITVNALTPTQPLLNAGSAYQPNCAAATLIADMLQYLFYQNIAECPLETLQQQQKSTANTLPSAPPHSVYTSDLTHRELWKDLFTEGTQIGSISAWEPQLGHRRSQLPFENLHGVKTYEKEGNAWLVPKCNSRHILVHLLEPDLAWIGLNLSPDHDLWIELNGEKIKDLAETKINNFEQVTHWLPVKEKADQYEMTICDRNVDYKIKKTVHFFIGVTVPDKKVATA